MHVGKGGWLGGEGARQGVTGTLQLTGLYTDRHTSNAQQEDAWVCFLATCTGQKLCQEARHTRSNLSTQLRSSPHYPIGDKSVYWAALFITDLVKMEKIVCRAAGIMTGQEHMWFGSSVHTRAAWCTQPLEECRAECTSLASVPGKHLHR